MTCIADRSVLLRTVAGLLLPFAALPSCFAGQGSPTAAFPPGSRPLIVLDPAHGGSDDGAHLAGNLLEKDVTLALAARLRASLTAAGFSVTSTREGDLTAVLSTDQRAELANRLHALACLVLHATATGSGAHLYVSSLDKPERMIAAIDGERQAFVPVPWNSAQAGIVDQSRTLSRDMFDALQSAHIPVVAGRAAIRPLDNLVCPAVVLEIAPLTTPQSDPTPVTDVGYQQHVAEAVAAALKAWRLDSTAPGPASSTAPKGADR